jgi:hypothetical protein
MFENEKLNIRTKSVPTAAAVWIITGVAPRVLRRPTGDVTFEWAAEHEAALQQYIRAKDAVDRLAEGGT